MTLVTVCVCTEEAEGSQAGQQPARWGWAGKGQTQALAQAALLIDRAAWGSQLCSPPPAFSNSTPAWGLPSPGIETLWTPTLPPTDQPICPILCPLQLSP